MFHKIVSTGLLLAALTASAPLSGCKSDPKPGQEAFERASGALDQYDSKLGFGEDEALATAFAEKAKEIDAELFSGGASNLDDATTGGHWMTHVERDGNAVVFLVRVPLLKRYKGADRTALMRDVLWEAAREVAPPDLEGTEVILAARGAAAYGGIARGKLADEPKIETSILVDPSPLYPHFEADVQ